MKTLTNPIDNTIQKAILNCQYIYIAVPFLSYSTVIRLFDKEKMNLVKEKHIVIKLDDSHSISYDLAAAKHLLECGFKVRFENSIHLKLYILGEQIFISSGNLTDGGLINNIELTVQTTELESNVRAVFEKLWSDSQANQVTLNYISENWEKYRFLKRKFPKENSKKTVLQPIKLSVTDEQLINLTLHHQTDWSRHFNIIELVNKGRSELIEKLKQNGFKEEYFYTPIGDKNRYSSLFYQFVYGQEEKLAGTGLREAQFRDVFTSPEFETLLFYIYPQFKQAKYSWDFSNEEDYYNFCKGLFEFQIRSFKETMPIRLANYFYPEFFLPIFKLSHLGEMCAILGFQSSSNESAIRLFEFNRFLNNRLKDLPYSNFIKSTILYRLLYVMKVKKEIDKNGTLGIENFIRSQKQQWVRDSMNFGLELIKNSEMLLSET